MQIAAAVGHTASACREREAPWGGSSLAAVLRAALSRVVDVERASALGFSCCCHAPHKHRCRESAIGEQLAGGQICNCCAVLVPCMERERSVP